MAKENENQVYKEYSNRRKRYKRRRNIMIISLLLLLAVVGVAYLINLYNRSYHDYKVMKTTEIKGENAVGYLSYGSSVIKYGKDGAVAYDKDANPLWNGSYEMSDPIADTCGKYVVIADKGNNSVHIYNEKGEVGSFATLYDIVKVEVAYQGVVAALMEEGDTNYIILYDSDGTKLDEAKNTVNNAGFPMDISLSDDGKKLVAIYLSVSEGDIVSNVVFYNFGDVGDNYTNQIVGGYIFDKGIVSPRAAFLNNDTVCVYKNNGFVIYSMKEKSKDVHEENLKGKIQSILYNKNYTGVVLESEDGTAKRLMLYNLTGKKVLDKTLDFDYKRIFMTDEEIIMYDDASCIIMKVNGKVKFKYTFEGNISDFYPINNLDRYYLINETKLSEIQISE
ncbi:MAG: DUF5711 family protein [Herbinix sp.]|nr:DUF5711 family protein [Herbinix sp.]